MTPHTRAILGSLTFAGTLYMCDDVTTTLIRRPFRTLTVRVIASSLRPITTLLFHVQDVAFLQLTTLTTLQHSTLTFEAWQIYVSRRHWLGRGSSYPLLTSLQTERITELFTLPRHASRTKTCTHHTTMRHPPAYLRPWHPHVHHVLPLMSAYASAYVHRTPL